MTSTPGFNCIFCKESFESKEELQLHFRKHGDPKFNQSSKLKSRFQNEGVDVKRNEEAEMVSCDVCSELFPTISKAITHKHKVHPDHDTKYFCPWCGKLFTMKHLYNKHLQSNHSELERNEDVNFHCDMCNVNFFIATAMLYHNKFFHRQDTDMPSIGQSKKLRMINHDILQIYYCAFCGDEYDNKVNLHKHIMDDHNDENQSPEDVLRCPLCEAVFYHLDAYELHLTFHSTEDLYTEKNELFEQITEFSLETVPPLMEKVENMEPQDAETTINNVGLEKFLEMAMDTSIDNDSDNPKKSKKHKKHKKSKKSAITLDEFLNMNKDVFGEGIDFQGVEEVPTKLVAKRLKQKKVDRQNMKNSQSTNIDKLKKQGIIVKKNPKNLNQSVKIDNKISNNMSQITPKSVTNKINPQAQTPDEVLSKFLNQSNPQIKIVKKSTTKNTMFQDKPTNTSDAENERCTTPENIEVECDVLQGGYTSSETESKDDHGQEPQKNGNNSKFVSSLSANESQTKLNESPQDSFNINSVTDIKSKKTDINDLNKKEYDNADKNCEANNVKSKPLNVDNNVKSLPKNDTTEQVKPTTATDNVKLNSQLVTNSSKSSLDALKHLSHLITVKSVNAKGNSAVLPNNKENKESNDPEFSASQNDSDQYEDEMPQSKPNEIESLAVSQTNEIKGTLKPLEALKSLNKNITVKPLTHSPKSVAEVVNNSDSVKNITNTVLDQNTSSINTIKSEPTVMSPKQSPKLKQIDAKDKHMSQKIEKHKTNENLLKHLTNITAKPISNQVSQATAFVKASNNQSIGKKNENPNENKKNEVEEDIEIFNIDDSDSDEAERSKLEVNTTETVTNEHTSNKSMEKLKKIQNVTVKSVNRQITQTNKNFIKKVPYLKETLQCSMSDFSDEDDQGMLMPANLSINQKLTLQSANIQALKNLGKHITVKPRNSSPSTSLISNKDLNLSQDSKDNMDDADSDYDSVPGKVKITELNDNFSEDEMNDKKESDEDNDANAFVQSPEGSNSDFDNDFNDDFDLSDVESQIKANNLKKPCDTQSQMANIKKINKDLTIKPLFKSNNEAQPSSSKGGVLLSGNKELSIKPYKQAKPETSIDSFTGKESKVAIRSMNQSVNQKVASHSQSNTLNKEVTVKTFQTKTVIQEITTTVTKTIKTVNQTVKQQAQSSSQPAAQPVKYQKVQGMKCSPNAPNFQGTAVRQAIAGTKVRGLNATRPATGTAVRSSNQLVPVRPSFHSPRPNPPRMPVRKVGPSASPSQQGSNVVKPIKISPNVVTSTKRTSEDAVGHFSCFKKPKESLIPVSDVPNFDNEQTNSTVHYASSHSRSNFSSATKTIRGNKVVTSTQIKTETSSSSQHLSKLNNLSGLKVVKTKNNQQSMQVEEKCELSAPQRNTLEAIEKLQKQGLLIKKPRMDTSRDSDASDEEGDQYFTEEPDD